MAKAVVLDVTDGPRTSVEDFVDKCLREDVTLIAVCGPGTREVEDEIDWAIIDHSEPDAHITTTAHEDEPIAEVFEFVVAFSDVDIVETVSL